MAQNITLLGASYSDVPAVTLPKTGGGTAQFDDTTDANATASDILSGKTAYVNGVKITGTGTGGGGGSVTQDQDGFIVLPPDGGGTPSGGLEYETGTWTPSVDIARPTISFTKSHDKAPTFVMMTDTTGTDDTTANSNYAFVYGSFDSYTGHAVPSDLTSGARLGLASYVYRGSGNPAQAVSGVTLSTGDSSSSSEGYWITSSGFIPSSASTTRYWRFGRTYKWIAVWATT